MRWKMARPTVLSDAYIAPFCRSVGASLGAAPSSNSANFSRNLKHQKPPKAWINGLPWGIKAWINGLPWGIKAWINGLPWGIN